MDKQNSLINEKVISYHNKFINWLKSRQLDVDTFAQSSEYASFREEAYFLRTIRNLVAHGNNTCDFITVHPSALDRIKKFVDTITTDSLEHVMIKYDDLLTALTTDKVLPVIKQLQAENFSYLPIVDENRVCVAMFSSFMLMSYVSLGLTIDQDTTFNDFCDVLLDNDSINIPETHEFMPVDTPLVEAINKFKVTDDFHNDTILVTQDGAESSPLLGMITIWDIQ